MFMSVFLKSKIKFFREKIQDFSPYNELIIFLIYIINHKCSSCSSSALHIHNFMHYVVMLEKVCIEIIQNVLYHGDEFSFRKLKHLVLLNDI